MFSRRGRPRHPDVLTPAEWRVVDGVRRGRTNAEIADDLGVSVNTVRYHVSNILAKLALPDRQALGAWRGRPRREWALAPVVAWSGVGVAAVVLGVALIVALPAIVIGGDATPPAALAAVAEPFDVRASSADYVAYDPAALRAAGLVDAGRILDGGTGDYQVLYRPGFLVARLEAPAFVPQQDLVIDATVVGKYEQDRLAAGERIYARVTSVGAHGYGGVGSVWASNTLTVSDAGTIHVAFNHTSALLMFEVRSADHAVLPAVIDRNGHLWVAPHAAPATGDVILYDTGAWLDTSAMERFDPWRPGGWHATWCSGDEPCHASSGSFGPVSAPVSGDVACTRRDHGYFSWKHVIEIRTDRWIVELDPIGVWGSACPSDLPASVVVGDELPPIDVNWSLTAYDLERRPVDIAFGRDGTLYIGEAYPRLPCGPCRSGS